MRYTLRRSQRQEKRAARDLGGKVQPGSGSMWHAKGDVKTDTLLLECKTTAGTGFRVTAKVLEKIRTEANRMGKEWALQVEFTHAFKMGPRRFAVIPWQDYLAMRESGR